MFSEDTSKRMDTFIQGHIYPNKSIHPDIVEEISRAKQRNLTAVPFALMPALKEKSNKRAAMWPSSRLTRYSTGTTLRLQGKERTRRIMSTVPILVGRNGKAELHAATPQDGTIFPDLAGFGDLAIGPHNLSEEPTVSTNWWGSLTNLITAGANIYTTVTAQQTATQIAEANARKAKAEAQRAQTQTFASRMFGTQAGSAGIMQYLPLMLLAGGGVAAVMLLTKPKKGRR